MNILQIDAFSFALHIMLLGVKIWTCYILYGLLKFEKSLNSNMAVYKVWQVILLTFSILYTVFEGYFVYTFFIPTPIWQYEYMAMTDQIIFTIVAIKYFTKEK